MEYLKDFSNKKDELFNKVFNKKCTKFIDILTNLYNSKNGIRNSDSLYMNFLISKFMKYILLPAEILKY